MMSQELSKLKLKLEKKEAKTRRSESQNFLAQTAWESKQVYDIISDKLSLSLKRYSRSDTCYKLTQKGKL